MKKILYAASTFSHLKQFHRPYLAFFAEHGFEVTVLAGGEPAELPEADKVIRIPFEKRIGSVKNFLLAWKMAKLIRRERYDVVSVHTTLAAFFVRLAVLLAGKGNTVVINTSHGYLFDDHTALPKRRLLLAAEQLVNPVTDWVLTMNRQDRTLAERYRFGKQRREIPGMGADLSRFQKPRTARADGTFRLVYAAEFSARKNQAMLIRAMARLPEHIHLFLLGSGATLAECRRLAASLRVSDRVHFEGFRPDVAAYYLAADVCVSSSRFEGLPFHLVEAMAAGLPVIASQVKGQEDLIVPGAGGFLYPFDDLPAFTALVRRLDADPDLCWRMGAENRRAAEAYGIQSVYPVVMGCLESCLPQLLTEERGAALPV